MRLQLIIASILFPFAGQTSAAFACNVWSDPTCIPPPPSRPCPNPWSNPNCGGDGDGDVAVNRVHSWICLQDTPRYAKRVSVEVLENYTRVTWRGKTCDLELDPEYRPTTYRDYRRFNSGSDACAEIFAAEGGVENIRLTSVRIAFAESLPILSKTLFLDLQPSDGFNFTWRFNCQESLHRE